MGTNVRDVMTARPRCVAPDTPLSQVAAVSYTHLTLPTTPYV